MKITSYDSTTIGSEQWQQWGAGWGHSGLVVRLLHGVAAGLMCNGVVWRDLSAVLGWWGFRVGGWGHGGACMLWRDLRATLGWCCGEVFVGQVGIEVGLAHRVGTALEQCHGKSCTP